MKVYIDSFGIVVSEQQASYELKLQGYTYSYAANGWWYDIKESSPRLPMSRLFSQIKIQNDLK